MLMKNAMGIQQKAGGYIPPLLALFQMIFEYLICLNLNYGLYLR